MDFDLLSLPEPGNTGEISYHECVAKAMMQCFSMRHASLEQVLDILKSQFPREQDLKVFVDRTCAQVEQALTDAKAKCPPGYTVALEVQEIFPTSKTLH